MESLDKAQQGDVLQVTSTPEPFTVTRRVGSFLVGTWRGTVARIDTRTSELITSQGKVRRVVRVLP